MKNSVRLALSALVCLILGSVSVNAQNISTVIGGGPAALAPTSASIGSPVAVRRDSLNNAYILDNTYGRVIKIDHTTGLMSVYAGNGTVGFSGDTFPATTAQMNAPSGMCFDPSNDNLYIADSDNAVIRVVIGPAAVTPSSLVATHPLGVTAGNIYTAVGIPTSTDPVYGGDGGSALSAHLHFPDGCSFDTNGNMYIADRANNEVRVVIGTSNAPPFGFTGTTAGFIYRFAGGTDGNNATQTAPTSGYGADGSLAVNAPNSGPFDVFVDRTTNNVYFADLGNNFMSDGTTPNTTGPANNNVVREVLASNGTIVTVAGVQGQFGHVASGTATATAINEPKGISVDGSGTLYFSDAANHVIRKVAGGNISVYAGTITVPGFFGDTGPATNAQMKFPAGTFLDSTGDLFISDGVNNVVREVPSISGGGMNALDIYTVAGNGHISYGGNNALALSGELNAPTGLAFDSTNNIYVADSGSDLVRVLTAVNGQMVTIAGQTEANGFSNGTVSPNDFGVLNGAISMAPDTAGNVYIADTANCIVRKRTPTGIATFAGIDPVVNNVNNPSAITPQCGFAAAGSAAIGTKLGVLNGIALDSHGNVFFSDSTNNVIWEVPVANSGAMVANNAYIVAGTPSTTGAFGGEAGPATQAQLNVPMGIYIDIYNNLFIADANNHRIREVPAVNIGSTMNAGSIYTIAGTGTQGITGDTGLATGAELQFPYAIVVDHNESVFFTDTTFSLDAAIAAPHAASSNTIRQIAGSGVAGKTQGHIYPVVNTAGTAGFNGDASALATTAKLNFPTGLAFAPNGGPGNTTANLLISDSVNNRVRSVAGIANNPPVPMVSFSQPNPFNAEPQGTASPSVAITLTNTGGANLTVSGFSFGGADAGDFTLDAATPTTCTAAPIAPNATCTVNVIFTPGAIGSRTATLIVAGNAFGPPQGALTGTGGTPMATLSPTSLTFASTTVNTAAATQTITLTNGGNAPTIILAGGILIGGANAGDFSETDLCVGPTGIAPGGTCTITVGFKPTATGARTATLTVNSNVGTASTATLSGTGAAATLSLTVADTDPSSTQTVTAGTAATYNLSVSGNQSVTTSITCTGAPTAATCTPSPASVAITPSTAGAFKVSVSTTARGAIVPFNQPSTKMQPPSFLQIAPMATLALLFVVAMLLASMQGQAGRARTLRLAMSLCLILMPIAASAVLVGCGGGSSSTTPPPATGTPAGTYTITVTATSGSTTANTTVTLVVN